MKVGERDYIWLDTLPLAQSERTFSGGTVTSNSLVYLHADQLNTPRLATNAMGSVVWRWDSDAFGVGAANLDPDGDTNLVNIRLRFPGQYLDEETGLHYNYFRDYDAGIGRYVKSDPIGLAGGLNTYAYAASNPLLYLDPDGQEYRAPGSFGHGRIINHGANVGGYIVDLPDGSALGLVGEPPPLSDVDFFYANCTWFKLTARNSSPISRPLRS